MSIVLALLGALRAALRTRTDLTLENLALRQQLALLRHRSKRPQFGSLDRLFWVWLSDRWAGWREALHLVRPETVIRWHRQGFRAFWNLEVPSTGEQVDRRSARRSRISCAPWRSPIRSGARHAFMARCSSLASTSRSALLPGSFRDGRNHPHRLGALSSRTISPTSSRSTSSSCQPRPSACSTSSWSCCIIAAGSCTSSPTAAWTAQQLVEAFPDDSAPRYLLRDRDSIYGGGFRQRVKGMRIAEVLTAPRSPWQNPFAERVIGTIRRELLGHVIIVNEDICVVVCAATSATTTARGRTLLSREMRPSRAPSSHPNSAASLRCPMSADFTTATSAAPPSRRRRTLPFGKEMRAQSALARRSCGRRRCRRALMLNPTAPAT